MPPTALRLQATLSLTLLFLMGCEHAGPLESDPIDGNEPVLFSTIQTRIFDTNCALSGCHTGDNPPMGMNLSQGLAYANIVNVESEESNLDRVEPGAPESSYLLKKIRGDADIVGMRMPLGRPALSAENIALIERWITEGAVND